MIVIIVIIQLYVIYQNGLTHTNWKFIPYLSGQKYVDAEEELFVNGIADSCKTSTSRKSLDYFTSGFCTFKLLKIALQL